MVRLTQETEIRSVSGLNNSYTLHPRKSGVPRNFVRGGGVSTNSVEDKENGNLGAVAL